MNVLLGYFDSPDQLIPAFDPGTGVACLVCARPLAAPMKTISLHGIGSDRSWFFRAHKGCWEALSDEEQGAYESSVIDNDGDTP